MKRFQTDISLNAVTTNSNGSNVNVEFADAVNFIVDVPVNTGTVVIVCEGSYDGTNWYTMFTDTFNATTGSYCHPASLIPFKYVRGRTASQSNATVSVRVATQIGLGGR